MGVYDTLIDGDRAAQVKCWKNLSCKNFHGGDKVPKKGSYTIILAPHGGGGYALIKKGVFTEITDDPGKVFLPYISKWGENLTAYIGPKSPIEKLLDELDER